jgi:alpha-tubulin suppressor-like RCC1 family protein
MSADKIASSLKKSLTIRDIYSLAREGYSAQNAFVMGQNNWGQLGVNDLIPRSSPMQIAGNNWQHIYTGVTHSIGDNVSSELWTWGQNNLGQLGHNDVVPRSSPVQVSGLGWDMSRIYFTNMSGNWSIFEKSDGTVWTSGNNADGRLGIDNIIPRSSPVQVLTDVKFSELHPSESWTIGIASTDRTLWAWGNNTHGQLGNFNTIPRSSPIQVNSDEWSKIAVGAFHVVGLKSDGTAWCWGRNNTGQLGFNDIISRSAPIQIGVLDGYTNVGAGWEQGFATRSGSLFSWGRNAAGSLGHNDVVPRSSPTQVSFNNGQWNSTFNLSGWGNDRTFSKTDDKTSQYLVWGNNNFNLLLTYTPFAATARSTPANFGVQGFVDRQFDGKDNRNRTPIYDNATVYFGWDNINIINRF